MVLTKLVKVYFVAVFSTLCVINSIPLSWFGFMNNLLIHYCNFCHVHQYTAKYGLCIALILDFLVISFMLCSYNV